MQQKQTIITIVAWLILTILPLNAVADEPVEVFLRGNTPLNPVSANPLTSTGEANWPMTGANPQRTSWTPEEVSGALKPLWFKPLKPFISPNVQVIAANNTLYISTARGLYALDADTGAEKWIYPTEFPLGHSPTITNGVAYVGGFDRKLHAINAQTGEALWTFEAGAGFQTNPLVVGNKVYAGSRDGYLYAIYTEGANPGGLAWKYQTQGPVLYSAAYQDGVVFFASNDGYAYALDAETGTHIWKSAKLPGAGFHSWWPVVYQDKVIFAGSNNYRNFLKPGLGDPGQVTKLIRIELDEVYPHHKDDPRGTPVGPYGNESGDWASGTTTIDTSTATSTSNGATIPITEYLEEKPWRRTYFVLDRTTGQEYTTDFDNDGQPEYAPFLWFGTHSGNRYPPVVGGDGVLYQSNNYMSDPYIAGGHITGWKINTPFISIPNSGWNAVDEPQAYAAGGNVIYWNRCCDRVGAAFDISQPGTVWSYFSYDLDVKAPGYDVGYEGSDVFSPGDGAFQAFGGINGIYGKHGDQNPPIPYLGKVYMHRGNSIIAFAPQADTLTTLPIATTVSVQDTVTISNTAQLKARLETEIQNIVDAGHLRPGYYSTGEFDFNARVCGEKWVDYWHNPADTIYTLISALPHLSPALQQQTQTYLQDEFTTYPPYQYWHIGWKDGAAREILDLPPEVETDRVNFPPQSQNSNSIFEGWKFPPHNFYAMWKYAELFGGADQIFDAAASNSYLMASFNTVPSDSLLEEMPYVHNAYIAGYIGFLELEDLAGRPESAGIRAELERLLALRAHTFSKDTMWDLSITDPHIKRCRTLNLARNFLFIVPELSQYLGDNARSKVQEAVEYYHEIAPYWFVTKFEGAYNEGVIVPAYDYYALFQAKAFILEQPVDELAKYLDIPAFERGDLFYIQNLIATIERGTANSPSPRFTLSIIPSAKTIKPGGVATYTIQIQPTGGFTSTIALTASTSPSLTLNLSPTTITSTEKATLTLTHIYTSAGSILLPGLRYTTIITAAGDDITDTDSVYLLVGGTRVYLPLVLKNN